MPFQELRKHEFVLSAKRLKDEKGVRALDVAKRLLDHGTMAPTIYFPALVDEALMIEPSETETREALDRFAEAMLTIAREDPVVLKEAPHNTAAQRIDEVYAAKELILSYLGLRRKLTGNLEGLRANAEGRKCESCSLILDTK
jgi:glycine dehydrogenase subunit 2